MLSQLSYTPVWWTFRDSNPGPTGYEPVALTNWATGPHMKADERTRTVNLLITNQLLCQLSHIGILNCQMTPTGFEPVLPPWKGDVLTAWPWGQVFKSSSPSRARTYNPSVNSRVLYHWAIEEYHLVNHGVLVNNNTFDLKMQVLFYLYLQNFTQKASNLTPSNNQRLFQSKLYSLLCMP